MMINKCPYIAKVNANITYEHLVHAILVLMGEGLDEDEAETALQAIGYVLLNAELFPDDLSEEILEETIAELKPLVLGDE